ncbi:exosome complex exonuclease Rrp41 [archaeon]|nr:exosome complex exonuclease Rrp41 [archaeon]
MARLNNRKDDELRPIEAKVGVIKNAIGSAMFRLGNTIAIAGVFGPREVHPRHATEATKAVLRTTYAMAPFATDDRGRPGPSRRSSEIGLVTRQALKEVIFLEDFPKTAIDVRIELIQADASTRCVGLNAASLALADAGIPMKDMVASCSAGIADGKVLLDIEGKEDSNGELDLPVAYYPKEKKLTLLQMDGMTNNKQMKEIIKLAIKGCEQIYEAQKKALREKYDISKNEVKKK